MSEQTMTREFRRHERALELAIASMAADECIKDFSDSHFDARIIARAEKFLDFLSSRP